MKQFANHFYWTLIFSSNEKGKGKRNQKSFHSSLITHHFLLFTFYFLLSTLVIAQSPQDAINLAAAHSSFANGLADRPGWTAVAYDTKNLYGIWRVQFYDAEGNDLGWSDISLEKQKVYAWETNFDITESETLLFGRDFGVGTDIETGPNGNLFVVSLSNGAIYEIFRR